MNNSKLDNSYFIILSFGFIYTIAFCDINLRGLFMPEYLSTTALSKLCGLKAKPLVFDFLIANDYLSYEEGRYKLTSKGLQYGHIRNGTSGGEWVVWDEEKLIPILKDFKLSLTQISSNDPLCLPRQDNLYSLADAYGLDEQAVVYSFLLSEGYLCPQASDSHYTLTTKGLEYCRIFSDGTYEHVVWDEEKLGPILVSLKFRIIEQSNIPFTFYHMTHIDNLPEIMSKGLFSHDSVGSYHDISNVSVNSRRQGKEPVFHRAIHSYVPLYFNIKNAMLYAVQSSYPDRVIILELYTGVCLSKNVLFTYNNAACSNAVFYSSVQKFIDANIWGRIQQRYWGDDIEVKQEMMSECLVLDHIDFRSIKNIHCNSEKTAQEAYDIVEKSSENNVKTVYAASNLFFR